MIVLCRFVDKIQQIKSIVPFKFSFTAVYDTFVHHDNVIESLMFFDHLLNIFAIAIIECKN